MRKADRFQLWFLQHTLMKVCLSVHKSFCTTQINYGLNEVWKF